MQLSVRAATESGGDNMQIDRAHRAHKFIALLLLETSEANNIVRIQRAVSTENVWG